MKTILSLIISATLVVSGYSQTRNVLVGTNNAVVQPTNFWSADASNARTGLGLGSAATNSTSAFQSSSAVLSNLALSNGSILTNIQSTSIVGVLGFIQGGTGSTNAATARTNLGLVWTGLTNANAGGFRSSLDLSAAWLTNTNVTNFRTDIGLGETNNVTFNSLHAEQNASSGIYTLTIGQTNTGFRGVGGGPSDFAYARDGSNQIAFIGSGIEVYTPSKYLTPLTLQYGSGSTAVLQFSGIDASIGAAISRTNLGLGWSALTNTNSGIGFVSVNTNGEVVSPTNFWQVSPANTRVQNSQPVVNATNSATNARNLYFYSLAISTTGVTNTVQLPTNSATLIGDVATVIHEGPTNSVTAVRSTGAGTNLIAINQFQEAVRFVYESSGWRLADNMFYGEPIKFSGTNTVANAAVSRTNLGLGATNNVTFSNVVASGTLTSTGVVTALTNLNVGGAIAVTNAAETRTNLGLPLAALTNANNSSFIESVLPSYADNENKVLGLNSSATELIWTTASGGVTSVDVSGGSTGMTFTNGPITSSGTITLGGTLSINNGGTGATDESSARENLNLGATWLTNTNVTNFRSDIGLGSAATNLSSAFQPSSSVLTNLANNDGGSLTNLNISGDVDLSTDVVGVLDITNGGTGASSAEEARTNLNLGAPWLVNTDVTNFRTDIGLGTNNDVRFNTIDVRALATVNFIPASFEGSYGFPLKIYTFDLPLEDSGINTTNHVAIGNGGGRFQIKNPSANWGYPLLTSSNGASVVMPTNWSVTNFRTSIGFPLSALTNTSNATFQEAIFTTNAAPTNPTTPNFGDHAAWMGVNIVTNGVTNTFLIPLYK